MHNYTIITFYYQYTITYGISNWTPVEPFSHSPVNKNHNVLLGESSGFIQKFKTLVLSENHSVDSKSMFIVFHICV